MNYVIAKIRGKEEIYEKLYAGAPIFSIPEGLERAVSYNPATLLDEDEWYKIDRFSETDYCINVLKDEFCSTDYTEANKVRNEKIEFIMSYQENVFFFSKNIET